MLSFHTVVSVSLLIGYFSTLISCYHSAYEEPRASYYGSALSGYQVNPASNECPNGYGHYGQVCLKMSKDFAGFTTAEDKCQLDGGHLAYPKNEDVYSKIKQLAETSRTGSYWVGIRRVNNQWRFSDGSPVSSFTRWASGQPVEVSENECVVMSMRYQHSWLTTGCKWGWRYVCQYDLNSDLDQPSRTIIQAGCDTNNLSPYHMRPLLQNRAETEFPVGTSISVVCQEGFAVRKPFLVECSTGGNWQVEGPCLRICPHLKLPPSVFLLNTTLPKNLIEGDVISFACPKEHTLEGERNTECGSSGNWSFPIPECVRKVIVVPATVQPVCPNVTVHEAEEDRDFNPTFPKIIPEIEYVKEGQSLLISCTKHFAIEPRSIRSTPKEWTWMKEQHIVDPNENSKFPNLKIDENGALIILKMLPRLEGLYTCVSFVEEEHLVAVRSIQVIIRPKCDMRFEIKSQDVVIAEGSYAILRCYIANATVTWYKGDELTKDDGSHVTLPNGALLIRNAHVMDTGSYKCVAEHVKTRCKVSHVISVEVHGTTENMCGVPLQTMSRLTQEDDNEDASDRGKIVGGQEVERGAHPWLALIVGDIPKSRGRSSKVFCGGALIDNHWVVTAAHCLRSLSSKTDATHLKIKLGKHSRTETDPTEKVFAIEKYVIHPQFDESSFDNDIALIKLKDRVGYSNFILPVCLPTAGFLNKYYPVNKSSAAGYVAGWGQLKEAGLQPNELRSVSLPLVEQDLCKKSTSAIVTENMFCAGYQQSAGDACKGDSGGPFEMVHGKKLFLAGVVSWGEGCARPAKYGFYTKVENFLNFIQSQMKE